MGIIKESLVFWNPDLGETELEATPYLYDNVGDVVQMRAKIRIENYVICQGDTSTDRQAGKTVILVNPTTELTGVIEQSNQLWTSDPTGFDTFKEGDEITIKNVSGTSATFEITRTIIEKRSNELLIVDQDFDTAPYNTFLYLNNGSVVYVSTPIEAIEFKDNLIENDSPPNYNDLTTGVTRKATVKGLDNTVTSDTAMKQLGDKCYQFGSLSVAGNNEGDGSDDPIVSQAFEIKRDLLISPIYTVDQVSNDVNGVAPPYLLNDKSLKYVFRVEASNKLSNPNDINIVDEFETRGNVGWENETPNTGTTNYSISNVVYKNLSGDTIDSIELTTNEQTVEFDIENTEDNSFSSGNSKIIFGHIFKPPSEKDYRLEEFPTGENTARHNLYKENFLKDRAVTTLDNAAASGVNLGGDDQIIKECESTFVSSSKAHVKATIKMASDAVDKISPLSPIEYKIWASTADHTLSRADSDKVNLPVDKKPYYIRVSDPTMITITNGFYDHPMIESDTVKETLLIRPQDDYVCESHFILNRNNEGDNIREGVAINITSVSMKLIARKGSEFFVLDEFSPDAISTQIIDDDTYGTIPNLDTVQDRGFESPVDDLRKNITVKSRTDLDTPATGLYNYVMRFPCIQRWEKHEPLPDANNQFLDDSAAPNHYKGKNHDWYHYFDSTGWDMYYRAEITATKDGLAETYTKETILSVEDYTDGTDWDTEEIKTYRTDGSSDLIPNQGLMDSENTLVECDMTYVGLDANPSLSDLVMQIHISEFEASNYKNLHSISSKYDIDSNNVFIGLNGDLTNTKSNPSGSIFRAEAEIRKPDFDTPRYASRFHDTRDAAPPVPPAVGILEEDGTFIIEEGLSTTYGIEE